MSLAAAREPLLCLVVVDDAGDVETPPLEPFLHERGQADVDGLADVRLDELGLGPAIHQDQLAVGADLFPQSFRTEALAALSAHGGVGLG